jgi:hypothetical protein
MSGVDFLERRGDRDEFADMLALYCEYVLIGEERLRSSSTSHLAYLMRIAAQECNDSSVNTGHRTKKPRESSLVKRTSRHHSK